MNNSTSTSSKRMATRVTVHDVVLRYGSLTAVDGVSFEIAPGEVLALVGPSGCGKTSLLKSIAGLEAIDNGTISFDGSRIDPVPPHKRNVGMVFQNYALFPHKRVSENVGYGLKMRGIADPDGKNVAAVLDLLRIGHLAEKWPDQLSGGQQQRVALARTLVVEPQVLLLDEPLSALDRQLRDDMRTEIRALTKTVGITTLLVTHDQDEAMSMADRVAVMNAGRIEQIGAPETLYSAPETAFVANFVGRINRFEAKCLENNGQTLTVELADGGVLEFPHSGTPLRPGSKLSVLARPEAITLAPGEAGPLTARVKDRHFMGSFVDVVLETRNSTMVRIEMRGAGQVPDPGTFCTLKLAPPGVFVFPQ